MLIFTCSCAYVDNDDDRDDIDVFLDWAGFWFYQGTEDTSTYYRAMHLAEKVLAKDLDNINAKLLYAYCLLKIGSWDSDNPRVKTAKKEFLELLDNEPENYRAHLGLGITYFKLSKNYSFLLTIFERAYSAIGNMIEQQEEIEKLKAAKNKEAAGKEHDLAKMVKSFTDDTRKVVRERVFPYKIYSTILKKEKPSIADIQEALDRRLTELLNSIYEASRDMPFNHTVFKEDLSKIELLIKMAVDNYREQYLEKLDKSEKEFKICLNLHEKYNRTFFWVYDHLALLYMLKASLYDDKPEIKKTILALERKYIEKYIHADIQFESKRILRINSEEYEKAQENPWLVAPIQNYKVIISGFIDQARQSRKKRIITLITLISKEYEDYNEGYKKELEEKTFKRISKDQEREYQNLLNWVKILESTEDSFEQTEHWQKPYLHHYYRAKIKLMKINTLEIIHQDLKEYISPKQLIELKIPKEELNLHKELWIEIIFEFNNFLKKSSIVKDAEGRKDADDYILQAVRRYPELESIAYRGLID